jgi:hypothetical protein
MGSDDLPDPELESGDDVAARGREGLHKLAKMLAFFRQELRIEGFDDEEAYALTEAWMLEALCEAQGGED